MRRPPKSTIAGSSPAQPTAAGGSGLAGGSGRLRTGSGHASLAQWIARRSSKPAGLGSSPRRRTMVRWSKRLTHLVLTQETAGSSPARTARGGVSAPQHAPLGPIVYGLGSRTFTPGKRVRLPLGLLRGSQVRLRHWAHNPDIGGSNPLPATTSGQAAHSPILRSLIGRAPAC
jgi:hypothetical protein